MAEEPATSPPPQSTPTQGGSDLGALAKATSVGGDLRALGAGAPVRAAYEASKRLGGHRVTFGALARRPAIPGALRRSLALPAEVPQDAIERTVASAERILAGDFTLFSQTKRVGFPPDYHQSFDGPNRWPRTPWWTIDIRSAARIADVKWVWELGRLGHAAILARAASATRDHLVESIGVLLRSWVEQNPFEIGIHWYSNLEIALRSIVLAEVTSRVGGLDPECDKLVAGQLWHGGRHLVADLPYTLSTMRNNHLLGDGLGLEVIADTLTDGPVDRTWAWVGDRLFTRQSRRHFRLDGSMVEDSLSYHRFVLEMLIVRTLLTSHAHPGPDPDLVSSAQMLARLGALEGPVPQYGDWDEGRVLISTQDPLDVGPSVRAALAIAGTGAPVEWRESYDECAWYVGTGDPIDPDAAERDGHDVGGGMARAQRGGFIVWLKAGSGPSHGHADLCSSPVLFDGQWVVGDPGTGTYNGPLEQRNYFRSSLSHSVLRLDGHDQLAAHRAFRWTYRAHGVVGPPIVSGHTVVMWGGHDAYVRLSPPRRVVRTVVVNSTFVAVADWVEGPPGPHYALSFPLGPGVRWNPLAGALDLPSGPALTLLLSSRPSATTGQEVPFDGWWSTTYGSIEPATRLEVCGTVQDGPVVWVLGRCGRTPPAEKTGANWITIGDLTLSVSWGAHVTWLTAEAQGRLTESILRWPVE